MNQPSIRDLCVPTSDGFYRLQISETAPPVRLFLTDKLFNEADLGLWAQIRNAASFPRTQAVRNTSRQVFMLTRTHS